MIRRSLLIIACTIFPRTLIAGEDCDTVYSDPVSILSDEWELPSEGGGFFLDRFQIEDLDGDGDLDVFSVTIDESYNGSPNYTLKYFEGENGKFCELMNSPSMSAVDRNVKIKILTRKNTRPTFVFEYTLANPEKLTTQKSISEFAFDANSHSYIDVSH